MCPGRERPAGARKLEGAFRITRRGLEGHRHEPRAQATAPDFALDSRACLL